MALLSGLLDFGAAKKNQKRQNEIARRMTALDAAEFDKRMGYVRDSSGRLDDLTRRQYDDTSRLEDETFSFLLNNNRTNFDEQQGMARAAFDGQMGLLDGLMTSQRGARLQAQALREAENARQAEYQGGADTLSRALPALIGFDAQEAGYGDALARRTAFMDRNTTPAAVPTFGARDSVLARVFAAETDRGMGEARTDAVNAAGLDARSDAFSGASRELVDFAGAVGKLARQAGNSRSALAPELDSVRIGQDMAQERFGAESDLLDRYSTQRSEAAGDFRQGEADARVRYGDALGGAVSDYFGRTMGAENAYIDRTMGSSTNYTNKALNLGNFKMQNTTTTNLLSNLIRGAEKAAGQALMKKYGF